MCKKYIRCKNFITETKPADKKNCINEVECGEYLIYFLQVESGGKII